MLLVLVHSEAGADRCDLEQHAARLEEVHRFEIEALDHRRGTRTSVADACAPLLQRVGLRRERDVVHGAGALAAVDLRRSRVVGVEAAAALSAHLPVLALATTEAERLAEQSLGADRRAAVGAHAREAEQRVLARESPGRVRAAPRRERSRARARVRGPPGRRTAGSRRSARTRRPAPRAARCQNSSVSVESTRQTIRCTMPAPACPRAAPGYSKNVRSMPGEPCSSP